MNLSKLIEYVRVHIGQGAPQKIDDFSKEGNPFIRAGSLESLTNAGNIDSLEFISDESAKRNKLKLYPINSVVFAKSGMSATKDRVYKLIRPCYVVSHLAILLPNEKTHPDYLRLVLQRYKPSTLIKDPAYPSISQGDIENFKLPFPPLDDQIRIATVLTRAERLIAKRKESIKALDELLKSTFLEMFGDPVRNEKGFDYRSLKEFYINFKNGTKCGPFGSALKKDEYVDSGIPVWNMDNISNDGRINPKVNLWITREKYQELNGYEAKNGDVIISRAGTVGKMCVLQTEHEQSIISTNLIRVRFGNDLLPVYFVSLMNYFKGRIGKLRTGPDGAFTHMNTGVLDELTFPYPPIELQSQFAAIVEKVESIKAKQTQSLAELENLYASLSQRAFKGELDLSLVPVVYVEAEPLESKNTISADVKVTKVFSKEELINILKTKAGTGCNFDELWSEIKKAAFEEMPEYEKVKELIYQMLEGTTPVLKQTFIIKRKENVDIKEMVLSVNR